MGFLIFTWIITSWSMFAVAAPTDEDPIKALFQRDVDNLPELRNSLALIEESREWRQRAIASYEAGKAEEAYRIIGWRTWNLPKESDDSKHAQLDANAADQLRGQVEVLKKLDAYHGVMTRALNLHDKGDVKEAHRISSEAASHFPEQPAAKWFAEQTKNGQIIPPGGSIEFINRTDYLIRSVDLHYSRGLPIFSSRIHHIVRDLKPGETQRLYTDDLPKGITKRLYVDLEIADGEPFKLMTSARVLSMNEFGFSPTIIIEKDGTVSFSEFSSKMKAERAKATPPPTIKDRIERIKELHSEGTDSG